MVRAFVFPGQGSQTVGMGLELAKAFPAARYVFQEVDEALGQDLSVLMFEGPEEELTLTENAQPALMAVSLATIRVLEEQGGFSLRDKGRFVAGHSLGEYSALAAVGALDLDETARLLRVRGRAMQQAVPVGEGAMAALLGLDVEAAMKIAREAAEDLVCEPANDNAPGQVVVSGNARAVERAVNLAKERGAKRAVLLSVSAPFHCSLMAPAQEVMREALAEATIRTPALPIVTNTTADETSDPEEIRRRLVDQVTQRVRWRESVEYMRDQGVTELVEIGAGKVLGGLTKRIDRSLTPVSLSGPGEVEQFLNEL